MKIAVVGTGYVGLVTGTCLAQTGNTVICVDNNTQKIGLMKTGRIPIYEPGLEKLFLRNVEEKRLSFTSDLKTAVEASEIIFLALPTPPGEDGSADLSYILGVADEIGEIIKDYKIIVNKSTVPVGTAEKVRDAIARRTSTEFDVVSNPEFLREGVAVEDFMKPDRIVIGTQSKKAGEKMAHLYEPFVRQGNPVIFMDERSAEMTKYAANAYLATRISFMNEIANLCETVGADVNAIRRGIGSDTRIGKRFLFPGVGYGGSCFPKDVRALSATAAEHGYDFKILRSVMQVNELQKEKLYDKINKHFSGNLRAKKIAVWGLAFKPNTDDIREAPALTLIHRLLDAGADVAAYDPEALANVKAACGDAIHYGADQYEILRGADALAVVTEWDVFRTPDFSKMVENMNRRLIFDGRNLYNFEDMKAFGFTYYGIGRKTIYGE